MRDCVCIDHVTDMWLDLVQTSSGEQLYYAVLVSLFSLLTWLVDSRQQGKGQHLAEEQGGKVLAVNQSCKLLVQKFLKVSG